MTRYYQPRIDAQTPQTPSDGLDVNPADPTAMARTAAERLQGTTKSIADLGPEFEALQNDSRFCAELDQLLFECEGCGWWCEAGEMSETDEWECLECTEGGRR